RKSCRASDPLESSSSRASFETILSASPRRQRRSIVQRTNRSPAYPIATAVEMSPPAVTSWSARARHRSTSARMPSPSILDPKMRLTASRVVLRGALHVTTRTQPSRSCSSDASAAVECSPLRSLSLCRRGEPAVTPTRPPYPSPSLVELGQRLNGPLGPSFVQRMNVYGVLKEQNDDDRRARQERTQRDRALASPRTFSE